MAIITAITGVFDAIFTWITGAFTAIWPVFYDAEDGLTLLGTVLLIGLAISVFFLVLGIIQNFLRLRS